MICRICQNPVSPLAADDLCADCAELKAALKAYYGSVGGADLANDAVRRAQVREGAKALVDAHVRAKARRAAAYVN